MLSVFQTLSGMPELGLFLATGLGYWLGGLRVGNFSLGTVTAALIVGLLLGMFWKEPSSDIRASFFLLFLFANGYSVGPQFATAVSRSGVGPMLLSVVVVVSGIVTTVVISRLLGLDAGVAAGLYSGAMTASAAMGTATDAINALPLPSETQHIMASHVVVADALCYVFGAIGVILFASVVAPRLLRIDLAAESRDLERQLGVTTEQVGVFSAKFRFAARSFQLRTDAGIIGKQVGDVEILEPGRTVFVARLKRGDVLLEATPGEKLHAGDIVVLFGHTAAVVEFGNRHGSEVVDEGVLDFPVGMLKVAVTNRAVTKLSAAELRLLPETRFVTVRSVFRGGQSLPLGSGLMLEPGDVVEVVGPLEAVERVAKLFGYPIRASSATSLSTVGFGILVGALIGAPYLMVGGFKVTLGVSVGVLLSGLAAGWLRTVRPLLPTVPEAAVQLMISLGLAVFVAGAGMQAGPVFVDAIRRLGVEILLAGVIVTLVPQIMALLVGRFVLKMHPVLLLGALAGAQTYTGALAAVQDRAGSRVAVLGYTVPYATSNVLLTLGGAIIVALMGV